MCARARSAPHRIGSAACASRLQQIRLRNTMKISFNKKTMFKSTIEREAFKARATVQRGGVATPCAASDRLQRRVLHYIVAMQASNLSAVVWYKAMQVRSRARALLWGLRTCTRAGWVHVRRMGRSLGCAACAAATRVQRGSCARLCCSVLPCDLLVFVRSNIVLVLL